MPRQPRAARYQITPAADADLDEIWEYLATNAGRAIADRIEARLHAAMKTLAATPGMGQIRADLADEPVRFWVVQRYLVIYRDQPRPIQVVRVLHAARDVRAIMGAQAP